MITTTTEAAEMTHAEERAATAALLARMETPEFEAEMAASAERARAMIAPNVLRLMEKQRGDREFAAYWENSAGASIERDYRNGNVRYIGEV